MKMQQKLSSPPRSNKHEQTNTYETRRDKNKWERRSRWWFWHQHNYQCIQAYFVTEQIHWVNEFVSYSLGHIDKGPCLHGKVIIQWHGMCAWYVYVSRCSQSVEKQQKLDGDKSHVQKEVNFKMHEKKGTTLNGEKIEISLLHGFHWLCIHFVCRLVCARLH